MIHVNRAQVSGRVSGETPIRLQGLNWDITSLTVTYDRGPDDVWVANRDVALNGDTLPDDYQGPVHTGSDHPQWVSDFITAARPDHRGVFAPWTSAPLQGSS